MSALANTQASTAPAAATENKEQVQDKKRLYVRWEVTDEAFKGAFEKFGAITDARVVRGVRLRNFGFVTYETEAAAAAALAAMNNKTLSTSALTIEFASSERGARPKRERPPRAQGAQGAQSTSTSTGAAQGAQQSGNKGAQQAGADAGAPRARGRGRRGRGGRGRRGGAAGGRGGAAGAGADGAGSAQASSNAGQAAQQSSNQAAAAARAAQREQEQKNPNYGKVVQLSPDPILTPLPKDAQLQELAAGQRFYRKDRADAKPVASLVLNADPTKGAFNCDFKLGEFALKLMSVSVVSKPGDTRVGCRVTHPDSGRSREVYFRARANGHNSHKFLELRRPRPLGADGQEVPLTDEPYEAFFVTIDNITLDVNTGLWKKIMLSLVSLTLVPRRDAPVRA